MFNGTSVSLNRCNRFWRDYLRTQVACDDAARIYKSAGGCYNQYDARAVAVPLLSKGGYGDPATAAHTGILAGIVQDSGIAERTKNLFAMGIANIIGLYFLMPVVKREMTGYLAKLRAGDYGVQASIPDVFKNARLVAEAARAAEIAALAG